MADSNPNPALYQLSKPASMGGVDAFVSHSWTDDPQHKWAALQEWRAQFKAEHQREPRVWLDKVCLHQDDLLNNLMCLPVFLAGCNQLLTLCGESYLGRLWCIVEIFVFLEMGGALEAVELRTLDCLNARTDNQLEGLVSHFNNFDARKATCSIAEENDRLLSIIEGANGGFGAFNETLGKAMVLLAHREHARKTQVHMTDWMANRSARGKNSTPRGTPRVSPTLLSRFLPSASARSIVISTNSSSSASSGNNEYSQRGGELNKPINLASSLATGDTAATAHSQSHTARRASKSPLRRASKLPLSAELAV
ncbi:hypothetical protein T492DRAFT_93455 [Pavlovales sp. CCMP2436]|nr:hypothetical protein T492DRAFT_93455 [Pavlovales sp. CCMP2436]